MPRQSDINLNLQGRFVETRRGESRCWKRIQTREGAKHILGSLGKYFNTRKL